MTSKQQAEDLIDKFLDYADADIDKQGLSFSKELRENAKRARSFALRKQSMHRA